MIINAQDQSPFLYQLQPGGPFYLANFINTSGCNWFGIVGRAFGRDGNPVINLTVHLEGGGISTDVLTGTGPSSLGPKVPGPREHKPDRRTI